MTTTLQANISIFFEENTKGEKMPEVFRAFKEKNERTRFST